MAIKGKRRPRGTRRGVASAPRPHLVIPKKPLFRRRGVQIFLVVLLVALAGGLVWWGLANQRSQRELAAQREDASSFGTFVEEVLRRRALGQPILTDYLILPELRAAVEQLRAGQGNDERLVEQARSWSEQATEGAQDIGELQPELPELREARNLMWRALQLYAGVADSLVAAPELQGKVRRDLLAALEKQIDSAEKVWDIGWGKLATVRARVGILEPASLPAPGQPGGIPGLP
jgi:hypothetical protein